MMRRLPIYNLLLAALLLTGCTLYMDEADIQPEEERGYDEAVHEVNDTVDVTYQFNSDTRSLTDHIQEYLVRVEADTILYFMDNTPTDYLPVKGGHVFSSCTEKLPWGLMHYVEWAGYQDGFYKVVCTPAGIKEVFKTFKLNVDRTIDRSKSRVLGYTDPDSLGEHVSEEVPNFTYAPYDMREFDDDGNEIITPAWARTRSEDSDGDHDQTEVSTFEFGFDSRNIVGGEPPGGFVCAAMYSRVPNWLKGGMHFRGKKKNKFTVGGKQVLGAETFKNFYWAFKYTRTNTEITHVCIDSDKDLFDYYVDDITEHKFTIEGGYCGGVETQWKPARDVMKKMGVSKRTELFQTIDGPEIAIPIWGPVSFVFNTSFDFELSFELCGKASFTRTTAKRKGMYYKDGELERIDKVLDEKSSNKLDFEIAGQAKAEITGHLGVGLRVGKGVTLDATFGGYVSAGIEVKASASLQELINSGGEKQPVSDRNYFRAYVQGGLEFGLKLSFIGKSLYDQKFPVGKVKVFAEYKTNPYPKINKDATFVYNLSGGDEAGGFDFSDVVFEMEMKYSDLGFLYKVLNWQFSPYIDIINAGTGKSVGTYYPTAATTSDWPLQNDKNYKYVYKFDNLERDVLYKAVPHLIEGSDDYVYNDNAVYFTSATPNILYVDDDEKGKGLRQIKVLEIGNDKRVFYVVADLSIVGAAKIKNWGLTVTVKSNSGKKILEKDFPIKKVKSKNYHILLNIFSNMPYGKVTVATYANVIGKDGKTSKVNYARRIIELSNNPFEFLGTEDEADDEFDFEFNGHQ